MIGEWPWVVGKHGQHQRRPSPPRTGCALVADELSAHRHLLEPRSVTGDGSALQVCRRGGRPTGAGAFGLAPGAIASVVSRSTSGQARRARARRRAACRAAGPRTGWPARPTGPVGSGRRGAGDAHSPAGHGACRWGRYARRCAAPHRPGGLPAWSRVSGRRRPIRSRWTSATPHQDGPRTAARSHRDPNRQMSPRGELPTWRECCMASPQRAAQAVTPEPSPSAGQIARSASPANFTTSPPCAPTSFDQLAEAVVQQLGKLLDTARPGSSQPFGEGREPRDIGEQDRRREPLAFRLNQWLMPIRKTPDDERGNITGELDRVAVSFMSARATGCSTSFSPAGAPRPFRYQAP